MSLLHGIGFHVWGWLSGSKVCGAGKQAGREDHGQAETHRHQLKLLATGLSPSQGRPTPSLKGLPTG